jgi:hypothetical protein
VFSNITQRLFTQIKSVHLLNNKRAPFSVMTSVLHFLQVEREIAPEVRLFDIFFDEVFSNLITSYDRYYLRSDSSFIKFFLGIFKNLTELITRRSDSWTKECIGNTENEGKREDEDVIYEKTNLLRQLLLRIKPLILSPHADLQVPALEIFALCAPLLHSKNIALLIRK